mmetsp:Transcript_20602/g.53243  ORF Transcript_20602/g.53243 Transcript_20602/m.53243 type:complete len:334 (+) Transcript_20602:222-1223(+)
MRHARVGRPMRQASARNQGGNRAALPPLRRLCQRRHPLRRWHALPPQTSLPATGTPTIPPLSTCRYTPESVDRRDEARAARPPLARPRWLWRGPAAPLARGAHRQAPQRRHRWPWQSLHPRRRGRASARHGASRSRTQPPQRTRRCTSDRRESFGTARWCWTQRWGSTRSRGRRSLPCASQRRLLRSPVHRAPKCRVPRCGGPRRNVSGRSRSLCGARGQRRLYRRGRRSHHDTRRPNVRRNRRDRRAHACGAGTAARAQAGPCHLSNRLESTSCGACQGRDAMASARRQSPHHRNLPPVCDLETLWPGPWRRRAPHRRSGLELCLRAPRLRG